MEPRIDDFDGFVGEVRSELRVIGMRLANIEARLDSMNEGMATRTDIAVLASTIRKRCIGTVITIAGVAFAAARLLH